ncbi:hypothetical protein [Gordonia polyisoprenivorans]|uniref:hypothetical protein n=1 Tax=Gordonia polyisoprenivorans TaxID=84595 RepID=UPI001AD6DD27|nr:hypothetical protein [Gordonia polyisoprenivorans]QTI68336.1 hypothetical protein J6U32_23015 [Gordonia polyisoprenivorans]
MARTPGQRKPGYRPKVAGSRRPADQVTDGTVTDQVTDAAAIDQVTDATATDATATSAQEKAAEKPVAAETIAAKPVVDEPEDVGEPEGAESEMVEPETASISLTKKDSDAEPTDSEATDAEATDPAATDSDVDAATEPERPTGKTRPVSRVSTIKPQPDAARSAQGNTQRGNGIGRRGPGRDRSADKERAAARRAERGWFSGRAIAIIAGVAALFAIAAVVLALHPGANVGDNKAFIDQAATTDLTSQAQSKFCQVQGARSKDFDNWAASARSALTGDALKQFNQGLPTIKEQFGQQDVTNDCKVDAVGVTRLSGDSDGSTADVILNFVASGTANGAPTQSVIGRYQLGLVKHGDQWLIQSYTDI